MDIAEDGTAESTNDFTHITRRLQDDCVEYRVCVVEASIKSEQDLRTRLRDIAKTAKEIAKTHLDGYIWQRDPFALDLVAARESLKVVEESAAQDKLADVDAPFPLTHSLYGQTNFGDSIADEWTIVYILRELSKECPDVWIRVSDGDGEFLLVEAANTLPKWLEPGIAEHRVWIHQGELRILEENDVPDRAITLSRAVTLLQSQPLHFSRQSKIEQAAFARLANYPSAFEDNFHNAVITIPRRVAYILHDTPARISAAVESFYLRDPVALRTLSTKDTGTLYFPPEDFVNVSVKFTRVGYAQLQSQDFALPGSWSGITPHVTESRVLMGMKVACGFEMLVQDVRNQDRKTVREIKILLEDIEAGDEKLPTDEVVKTWSQRQDSEDWLDIKFDDLDKTLAERTAGKGAQRDTATDMTAEESLKKMSSGFESFLNDDKAGLDGAGAGDDDDFSDKESASTSEPDSEGEDKDGSFNEDEFEQAMREMMGLSHEQKEKNGMFDEARKLALEMEDDENMVEDEDEIRKLMEEMGAELDNLGVLDLNNGFNDALRKGKRVDTGPEGQDWQPDEYGNEKTELVKNLLASLKGQGGMSGPTSNMLTAMGIRMPRDEDVDDDSD